MTTQGKRITRATVKVAKKQKMLRGQKKLRKATSMDGLLTVTAAAAYLGKSRQNLLYHVQQGNVVEVEPPCLGCKGRVVTLESAEKLRGELAVRDEKIEAKKEKRAAKEAAAAEAAAQVEVVTEEVAPVENCVEEVESAEAAPATSEEPVAPAAETWAVEDFADEEPPDEAEDTPEDDDDEDLDWEE